MSNRNLTFTQYVILGIAFELSVWNFSEIHKEGINYFFNEFLPAEVSGAIVIVVAVIWVYCVYYLVKKVLQWIKIRRKEDKKKVSKIFTGGAQNV